MNLADPLQGETCFLNVFHFQKIEKDCYYCTDSRKKINATNLGNNNQRKVQFDFGHVHNNKTKNHLA